MNKVPKRVFIVPYRNRQEHKFFFLRQMSFLLENAEDYEIYFSHPCDPRAFNRGAVRNIGFLAVKQKYPNDYKNMSFIFNDVDTLPFHRLFNYETVRGVVKHYYGYEYALGGIVVINGGDFEKINGYPCYWGWGMEDNSLQKRCRRFGISIDRSTFFKIGSPEILQLFDGISRIISQNDPWRSENDKGTDGLITLSKLDYSIDAESLNPSDNTFTITENAARIFYVNIKWFETETKFESQHYSNYDLRAPKRKIVKPIFHPTAAAAAATLPRQEKETWTNIPYYPTSKERRAQLARQLLERKQALPPQLIAQIKADKIAYIQTDAFNKNIPLLPHHHHHHHHHPSQKPAGFLGNQRHF
jgi:hypothetical protein